MLDQLVIDGRVYLHEAVERYEKEPTPVVSETLLKHAVITVGCHQYGTQVAREPTGNQRVFARVRSIREKKARVAVFIASPSFDMSKVGLLK